MLSSDKRFFSRQTAKKLLCLIFSLLFSYTSIAGVSAAPALPFFKPSAPKLYPSPMPAPRAVNPIFNLPAENEPVLVNSSLTEVDTANVSLGYIKLRTLTNTSITLRIMFTLIDENGKELKKYSRFFLRSDTKWDALNFTFGDGKYVITIYDVSSSKNAILLQKVSVDVKLQDEYVPFLVPIKYSSFTQKSDCVSAAIQLSKKYDNDLDRLSAIWQWIVTNVAYDTSLAADVVTEKVVGYVPDPDETYLKRIGICSNYASLMAAMCRAVGIPTKIVIGKAVDDKGNSITHAWTEVFIKEKGSIDINGKFEFKGNTYVRMDPTFAASNSSGKYTELIGNGENYTSAEFY